MNEHVCYARVALLDCVFYSMGDFVAVVHRNFAVHYDVEIDIKIQTHLASTAFFNFDDTGDRAGN